MGSLDLGKGGAGGELKEENCVPLRDPHFKDFDKPQPYGGNVETWLSWLKAFKNPPTPPELERVRP